MHDSSGTPFHSANSCTETQCLTNSIAFRLAVQIMSKRTKDLQHHLNNSYYINVKLVLGTKFETISIYFQSTTNFLFRNISKYFRNTDNNFRICFHELQFRKLRSTYSANIYKLYVCSLTYFSDNILANNNFKNNAKSVLEL